MKLTIEDQEKIRKIKDKITFLEKRIAEESTRENVGGWTPVTSDLDEISKLKEHIKVIKYARRQEE